LLCQFFRFDVECARRVSLLQSDINAADPAVVHANVGYDVSAFIGYCDIHGLANFTAFFSAALITRRASSNFTAVIGLLFMFYAAAPDRELTGRSLRGLSLAPSLSRW